MKTISLSRKVYNKNVFGAALIILVLISSCKEKDNEPKPVKVCAPNYYGDGTNCSSFASAYATSTGTLTDFCSASGAVSPYTVSIVPTPNKPLEFVIAGLRQIPNAITSCTINPSNRSEFSAARQPIINGFDIAIQSGTLSENGASITLYYQVFGAGSNVASNVCTSTIVK